MLFCWSFDTSPTLPCSLNCSNSTPFPGKRGLIQWSGMRNCRLLWQPCHKYWLLQKCYISWSPPAACMSRNIFWQLWPFPNPNPSWLCQSGVQESQLLRRPAAAAGGTMCEPPQRQVLFISTLTLSRDSQRGYARSHLS